LRARVGDIVQLSFVNQVNPNRFDLNLDINDCMTVGENGGTYPSSFDASPNCLHASSTSNIHFHGTHTNPDSTGDNVYLQVRPLPRDNQGNLTTTPAEATASFAEFFANCSEQLQDPLNRWPSRWSDLPQAYTDMQTELLMAYQQNNPGQPLWDEDEQLLSVGWPQYYIGAVPYCFALPAYTADVWPPPEGSTSPRMGQAPGTHWYHAHKHGSTAINVMNGMTGAMIIEGQYDDDLNAAYGGYMLEDGPWNTRAQPVMVLNQLGVTPSILVGGAPSTPRQFSVNGRFRPVVQMQPGEIQLWRIANTAGRSAAYFMAPQGFAWRQLAQDGVQLANENYQTSENQPLYVAPGNRVDLLVQAPTEPMTADVLIQNVVARAKVLPTPAPPSTERNPGTPLMSINVSGPQVTQDGQPVQMPFLARAPEQPLFLADITDEELSRNQYGGKTLIFNSKPSLDPMQHTINHIQFTDKDAVVNVNLSAVEEWTIQNTTSASKTGPGLIDHPFHIHINPFQITEFFDPNENLVDPTTGQLEGQVVKGKTVPIPRYVTAKELITDPRQCFLDPADPSKWAPACGAPSSPQSDLVWWDVFAIPSGRAATDVNGKPINKPDGTPLVIPGYFKMRSRFVDYPGTYVLHCHILIHEDRGMMFSVSVAELPPSLLRHH
jgi:FtsP/CotA-like multicopper oxidase with cupredoxin domain